MNSLIAILMLHKYYLYLLSVVKTIKINKNNHELVKKYLIQLTTYTKSNSTLTTIITI